MGSIKPTPLREIAVPGHARCFEPGSTFGEYTIVRRIGRGGQGSVFEVKDGLGLHWALKVSEEMALQDANAEMRFAREARCVAETLCSLPRHSGVFVGEHYGVWERRFYVKMKLLRGESLAQRLRRVGQLSIHEAVRVAEKIASAIGQAHELGVLHRDLKPENIFINQDGEVVVLDWGCLQLIEAGQAGTTLRGVICTPGYAPIEQYLATTALNLTPAVDLYALGVMLYEALAGYHPFLNWSRAALNTPQIPQPVEPVASNAPVGVVEAPVNDGSIITVRVVDDVFGAQTEQHQVPRELLAQLRSVVTGGVTWRSARDGRDPADEAQRSGVSLDSDGYSTLGTEVLHPPLRRSTVNISAGDVSGRNRSATSRSKAGGEPWPVVSAPSGGPPSSGWSLPPQAPVEPGVTHTADPLAAPTSAHPASPSIEAGEKAAVVAPLAASPNAALRQRPPKGDVPRRFSLVEVLAFQERTKPRPIEGIPPDLSTLVLQLLSKRPGERPQSAKEVAERLRALLPRLESAVEEFAVSTPEQNSRYLSRALLWIRLRQNSQRWTWAAAGVIVACLAGMGTYYGMNTSQAAATGVPKAFVTTGGEPSPRDAPPSQAAGEAPASGLATATGKVVPLAPTAVLAESSGEPIGEPIVEGLAEPAASAARLTPPNKKRRVAADALHRLDGSETKSAVTARGSGDSAALRPSPGASRANDEQGPAPAESCDGLCKEKDRAAPTPSRRLQAKPNATLHRAPNKLWVD